MWNKEAEMVQALEEERSQKEQHLASSVCTQMAASSGTPSPQDQWEAEGETGGGHLGTGSTNQGTLQGTTLCEMVAMVTSEGSQLEKAVIHC